jgi:hypothetical protein
MNDQKKDQRRFPRVFLQNADVFRALVGAKLIWSADVTTDLLDLSYTGAAAVQPPARHFEKGQALSLDFSFAGQAPVKVNAKVVRSDGKIVGLQFSELEAPARLAFENFLNDNLLGLNLRQVDPKLFSQSQDFTNWYHGPKDTNVFIWTLNGSLTKAIVEIDHLILVWNQGVLKQGKSRSDLSSAIDDYYSPVLYESLRAGQSVDQILLSRVVKILSQVNEPHGPVSSLLEKLKGAASK